METLNLTDAAHFLKMNSEVLRRQAKIGKIPGKKPGKRWIFIKEHLADWVSGRYPDSGRELRVIDSSNQHKESTKKCQFTSAKKHGGYNSPHQMDAEYNNLLGLKQNRRHKNYMTD